MRILVLSQFFNPEPLPKPFDIAKALQDRGHQVTVLTGIPNYPSGAVYPGYAAWKPRREEIEGVDVLRVPLYPSHDRSVFRRSLSYLTFMASSVLGALFLGRFDVIYVRHPPLTMGVSAWAISRLKRAPFVYDVQDIWPESGIWSGMLRPGRLYGLLLSLERWVYRRANHILAVTDGAKANITSKGVTPDRVSVVSQIVDEATFAAGPMPGDDPGVLGLRRILAPEGGFVVMYAGNVGLVQGLDIVLNAAEKDSCGDIWWVIVGGGADRNRLRRIARERGLKNVVFVDPRPPDEVPRYLAAADAVLLSLRESPLLEASIPLKTFSYLASGRPILAAISGAAGSLLDLAGAGVSIAPGDSKGLLEAALKLKGLPAAQRDSMGSSGRRYLESELSREKILEHHCRIIERMAGTEPRTAR